MTDMSLKQGLTDTSFFVRNIADGKHTQNRLPPAQDRLQCPVRGTQELEGAQGRNWDPPLLAWTPKRRTSGRVQKFLNSRATRIRPSGSAAQPVSTQCHSCRRCCRRRRRCCCYLADTIICPTLVKPPRKRGRSSWASSSGDLLLLLEFSGGDPLERYAGVQGRRTATLYYQAADRRTTSAHSPPARPPARVRNARRAGGGNPDGPDDVYPGVFVLSFPTHLHPLLASFAYFSFPFSFGACVRGAEGTHGSPMAE